MLARPRHRPVCSGAMGRLIGLIRDLAPCRGAASWLVSSALLFSPTRTNPAVVCSLAAIALTLTGGTMLDPRESHSEEVATGGGRVALIDVQMIERTRKGELDACEITYTVAFEDHIYRRGDLTVLRGAISLMGFSGAKDKPPAIMLKTTAFDMVNNKPVFAPLEHAFLSAGGVSYAGKEFVSFTCEDGGMCVGYELLKNPDLYARIEDRFEINITRANGDSDVAVPISLTERMDVAQKFLDCSGKLMEVIQKKFGQ